MIFENCLKLEFYESLKKELIELNDDDKYICNLVNCNEVDNNNYIITLKVYLIYYSLI